MTTSAASDLVVAPASICRANRRANCGGWNAGLPVRLAAWRSGTRLG
jgi:hypothetical protein